MHRTIEACSARIARCSLRVRQPGQIIATMKYLHHARRPEDARLVAEALRISLDTADEAAGPVGPP